MAKHLTNLTARSCAAGCVVLCVFLGATETGGQQSKPQISFGQVRLELGMPETGVMARLSEHYRLLNTRPGNWAVMERKPALPGVGSVAFRDGRLSSVKKTWMQQPPSGGGAGDPVAIARAFYLITSEFIKEGRRTCSIGTDDSVDGSTAYLVCGEKEIRVFVFRNKQVGTTAMVEEVLPGVK